MRSDQPATPPAHAATSRSDRLKEALRANLRRRKQQQRARGTHGAEQDGHEAAPKPREDSA